MVGTSTFSAQRRFPYRDGYINFDVVAIALEERVFRHLGGDVEIARRRSLGTSVAFARNAQAGSGAGSRRNANFHRFGERYTPFAAAGGAGIAEFAAAAAARAGEVKLHRAGHLGDIAGALTLRAGDFSRCAGACAMTGAADLVAGDFPGGSACP